MLKSPNILDTVGLFIHVDKLIQVHGEPKEKKPQSHLWPQPQWEWVQETYSVFLLKRENL